MDRPLEPGYPPCLNTQVADPIFLYDACCLMDVLFFLLRRGLKASLSLMQQARIYHTMWLRCVYTLCYVWLSNSSQTSLPILRVHTNTPSGTGMLWAFRPASDGLARVEGHVPPQAICGPADVADLATRNHVVPMLDSDDASIT